MTAKGHVLLAVTPLALVFGDRVLHDPLVTSCAVAAGIGALVPDIDEPKSYLGRRLFFVSEVLKGIGIRHRTLTHRLLVPVAVALMSLILYSGSDLMVALAFAYGIFMHGIGDLLTKGGIDGYLYPLADGTVRLLPKERAFYTGSVAEYMLMAGLALVSAVRVWGGAL